MSTPCRLDARHKLPFSVSLWRHQKLYSRDHSRWRIRNDWRGYSAIRWKCARRTLPQNYYLRLCVYGKWPRGGPEYNGGPEYTAYFQLRCRQAESSQIQDCSSGKLSKAFHTSTATVTAVRRELCFRKAKKNHNHIMNVNNPGSDGRPRSSLLRTPGWLRGFLRGVLRWFGLPTASLWPSFTWGGSSGRAGPIHISMRAPETTVVVPIYNGSHYRDSQYTLINLVRSTSTHVCTSIVKNSSDWNTDIYI